MNRYTRTVIEYLKDAPDEHWMSYAPAPQRGRGLEVLDWMVKQPRMPDAAALAWYWNLDPLDAFRNRTRTNDDLSTLEWRRRTIIELQANYLNGSYKAVSFGYDPRRSLNCDSYVTLYLTGHMQKQDDDIVIPSQMLEAINRPELDYLSYLEGIDGLPESVLAGMYEWSDADWAE